MNFHLRPYNQYILNIVTNIYLGLDYKEKKYIEEYIALKEHKRQSIINQQYSQLRTEIAYEFGHLLSYSDQTIEQYINMNNEKENDEGEVSYDH